MKTIWIDGKQMADKICQQLKKRISNLPRAPRLDVIWVGDNPASAVYVYHKQKRAESIGIQVEIHHLPETTTQDELYQLLEQLNENRMVDGIIVQMPLPKHIHSHLILETISPQKDVDGLTSFNLGRLLSGVPQLVPCTPQACLTMIESVEQDLSGKVALVIGRSRLVGKPLFQLLLAKHCTMIQAHSVTQNLHELCQMADIVISATGQAGLIGAKDIKPGTIVIDVGISRQSDGSLKGDVRSHELEGIARAVTPVPGGVGPMTVAMLMLNTVQAAEMRLGF